MSKSKVYAYDPCSVQVWFRGLLINGGFSPALHVHELILGEKTMSDQKIETKEVTALYAIENRFNGQSLPLGRMTLYATETKIEPGTVHELSAEGFFTQHGDFVPYAGFVPEPATAKREDGRVMIQLQPGQWCFQPRV